MKFWIKILILKTINIKIFLNNYNKEHFILIKINF